VNPKNIATSNQSKLSEGSYEQGVTGSIFKPDKRDDRTNFKF